MQALHWGVPLLCTCEAREANRRGAAEGEGEGGRVEPLKRSELPAPHPHHDHR